MRKVISIFLLLISLNAIVEFVVSTGTCQTLLTTSSSQTYALGLACYGAVDYTFYVPSGVTLAYLNSKAMAALSSKSLSTLPTSCQTALKKAVCANIYLKCQPGIDLTDTSTWNYGIFKNLTSNVSLTVPVPFQRPCVSVCSNANSYCYGILNIFKSAPNCYSRTDYSFGALTSLPTYPYTYDQSSSSSSCNAMTAKVPIAGTKEPYLFAASGACAGITTEVYVPPGPSVSAALAPMQQPYVVQSAIETALKATFSQLPVYLSESCYQSLRKYFCGSYFLAPQLQNIKAVLVKNGYNVAQVSYLLQAYYSVNATAFLAHSFYLPSYPNRTVCYDYSSNCGEFIDVAGQAALVPNCKKYTNGTYAFPTTDQVIAALPLTSTASLKFTTSPNSMSGTTTNGFETKCPYGFIKPEDPTHPHIVWVTGTGCSFPCRLSVWTNTDFNRFDKMVRVIPGIGFPFLLAVIATYLVCETRRTKQYLVCYAAFCAWILSIAFLSMATNTAGESVTAPSRFCANDATHITPSSGDRKCIKQAGVILYFALSLCFTYGIIAFDVYGGLVMNWVHKSWYRVAIDIILVTLLPGLGLGGALKNHMLGYNKQAPYCFIRYDLDPANGDFRVFYLPVMAVFLIAMLLILRTLIRVVGMGVQVITYGTNAVAVEGGGQDPELQLFVRQWRYHWKSLLFIMFETAMWFTLFAARFSSQRNSEWIKEQVKAWVTCIFKNWDGVTTPSWRDTCGYYPSFRGHYSRQQWAYFCMIGHCVIVPLFYLPSVYRSLMACITGKRPGDNGEKMGAKTAAATSNGQMFGV